MTTEDADGGIESIGSVTLTTQAMANSDAWAECSAVVYRLPPEGRPSIVLRTEQADAVDTYTKDTEKKLVRIVDSVEGEQLHTDEQTTRRRQNPIRRQQSRHPS